MVLARAAAVESASEHPIANALVVHARSLGVEWRQVEDFGTNQGRG